MSVTDPRGEYDDLLEWHVEETVAADTFEHHREMEAYRSGWVATALAFDEDDRLLLAYHDDDEQWLAPGGTLQPGESLTEGLVREVREETGVTVAPTRPRGICDVVTRHADDPDRTTSFSVVFFEAAAESTALGNDLGEDDEAIADAGWFERLPENVYNRDGTEDLLAECPQWPPSR